MFRLKDDKTKYLMFFVSSFESFHFVLLRLAVKMCLFTPLTSHEDKTR